MRGKRKGSIENELTDGVKIVINGDVVNRVLNSAVAGMKETIGETRVRPPRSLDCPQRRAAESFSQDDLKPLLPPLWR